MYVCDQCYIIPLFKGDVLSVAESKDTKSVNLDGGRCSHFGYLPEGIANSTCDVIYMGVCGVVTVASSASSLSFSTISKSCPLVSYSLLVASTPVKRYAAHLSVHHLDECSWDTTLVYQNGQLSYVIVCLAPAQFRS